MKQWLIPAKTFLVGEYVATRGGPALLLTTTPAFELSLTPQPGVSGVHPDAPAAHFWQRAPRGSGLLWHDPYQGLGGLGASSAQYLGAYAAAGYLEQQPLCARALLAQYLADNGNHDGVAPSGYDVLAQTLHGMVYLHKQQAECSTFTWPWADLAFILVHTGKKLATHHHLAQLRLPTDLHPLAELVDMARQAVLQADSTGILAVVNRYHNALMALNLVAPHSVELMSAWRDWSDILAMKGCGALGADVLLLLLRPARVAAVCTSLRAQGLVVLATHADLYSSPGLLRDKDIFLTNCH